MAEAFPWSHHSRFAYLMDNHNSVLGIRESALQRGASAAAVTMHHDQHGQLPNLLARPHNICTCMLTCICDSET